MNDGIINMLCEVYMLIKHGVRNRKLRCPECNKIIDKFYPGYFPHTGGLTGPDGKQWWFYIVCPNCKREISYTELLKQLDEVE